MTRSKSRSGHRTALHGAMAVALGMLPAASMAREAPSSLCTMPEVMRHVTEALHRKVPYARIVAAPVGERPGPRPDTVLCAVYVEQRRPDAVYGAVRWLDQQDYAVRWLDPGFEVTLRALRRPDPASPGQRQRSGAVVR